ncbi:MAG TPA: choice-of-anchor P family protein, partial [Candidatus Dormibacteraeota bacterium]|nr:choice-of-anchor P family protein [Candidatus Dormibacteraeota bacterium]
MADRVRRQRRPRRGRPAPPPPASVLELTGHSVERVQPPRPRPTWAWSQTISLATASELEAAGASRTLRVTGSDEPQSVRSTGAPGWAWKGNGTAVMPAVVFAEPLVAVEEAAPPAPAATATAPAGARRGLIERAAVLGVPALVALGVAIVLSRVLPEPSGAGAEALWWSVLAVSGLAALVLVDLAARRLRPSALAGAGLPRLGGGLGEMTVVVAIGALLAGAGVLHMPAPTGGGGSVTAVRAVQPEGLAPAAAPPLAIAPAPAVPLLPAERAPVTGGGGAELADALLDPTLATLPVVVHAANRAALPLRLGAARGGAAADAAALSGTLGVPGAAPVSLGPLAPASATTAPSQPSASSESGVTACGGADAAACPAEQVHSLSSEATSALATVERGAVPACSPAAGNMPAPPLASACVQAVHMEMLLTDLPMAVVADGISSSALTSGCPAVPLGRMSVGDLQIGGVHVAGGPGALIPTSTPEPNTTVALATGTVVLNEQRLDRGSRGLTVNAVHIIAPASLLSPFSLDMLIGHSHSAATP